ncbi:MAG: 5'-nucleotidase C-terminal domain-containing protein [Oscillospiraceae bacterium]|nr:5'-nucleotidase C-terminal domain-containing protein [Oscillospiraceae bacterium]
MKAFRLAVILAAAVMLLTRASAAYAGDDVVGTLPEKLRMSEGSSRETAVDSTTAQFSLGSAASDAARIAGDADVAVLFGGDMFNNIMGGNVSWSAVKDAFASDRELGAAIITSAELFNLLEFGFSHIVVGEDEKIDRTASSFYGFPQVSGFRVTFDASAPALSRITEIVLDDGRSLDPADTLTALRIAAPTGMFEGGYGYPILPYAPLEITQAQALAALIASGSPLYGEAADKRIQVIGDAERFAIGSSQVRSILLVSALALSAIVLAGAKRKRASRTNLDEFIDSH